MTPPRVLVCALMPEDDRDSGSRRVLHLLDYLQDGGWAITFVSHHPNPRLRYVRALQQRGIEVFAGSGKWMDQLIASAVYDLAIFGLWDIAEPFIGRVRAGSPQTRIIVDSIDLHFLRNARRAFVAGDAGALDAGYGDEMVRELNTYARTDGVLTVSDKEAALIGDFLGDSELAHAVPDGEDIAMSSVPLDQRRGVVYVGCYRFAPNADAVKYFCGDVLPQMPPRLLDRHPVYFLGDGLDDTLRALGKGWPQVRMVGWVPDVKPYLDRARINIVPLRFGAGTKRKVVHALMQGTPTVATSIGAEGLSLRHEQHLLIADTAASFAAATERLLTDDALWQQLQVAGSTHMAGRHGRDVPRRKLQQMLQRVMSRPPKRSSTATMVTTPAPMTPVAYQHLVARLLARIEIALPPDARILVISKGDDALLRVGSRQAWHFPQAPDGRYAGHYPATSHEAILELEKTRRRLGATCVVLPATARWWLDHYDGLRKHFAKYYQVIADEPESGVIYGRRDKRAGTTIEVVSQPATPDGADRGDSVAAAPRLIAFVLPQFHPIPENDAWWGKGFTEWSNVIAAQPLFGGHYQPRLPADLGFYDLRLPEVRQQQADLAREHGLHGFCYYHYWFGGKRLLERPFDAILASKQPRFPFCLCWANEPWSRRWDGRPHDVLQAQTYSHDDDRAHIKALIPALTDDRAIRINGRPAFLVYQARDLPDAGRTVEIWREEAHKAGLAEGLYLLACETGWDAGVDVTAAGFDAKVLFQPQFSMLFNSNSRISVPGKEHLRVFDYDKAWRLLARPEPVSYRRFDTVFPSWDNTARIGERGVVLHNSTPAAYQEWLELALTRAAALPAGERVVFINAWNEWAEGCHLEPDRRHGLAYLEATRRALDRVSRSAIVARAEDTPPRPVQARLEVGA